MRLTNSLRLQILRWLLTPLAGLVVFDAAGAYSDAHRIARLITDRSLLASVHAIAEHVAVENGDIGVEIPPSALEMLITNAQDRIFYRVTDSRGELLAGYPEVPGPPGKLTELVEDKYDARVRGMQVRAVALRRPVFGTSRAHDVTIIVAQTYHADDTLVASFWWQAVLQQSGLVLIAGLLAWFGMNRGLDTLNRLSREIAERPPNTLDFIADDHVQTEIRPFIQAINRSVERVRRQIAMQTSFIADASHQLRTPLTLMRTQTALGARADTLEEKDQVLRGLSETVDHMVHLTNQLLTLSKVEPWSEMLKDNVVDLAVVTRTVLERQADIALARNIALSLSLEQEEGLLVAGSRTVANELVSNLVDNALRYCGEDGTVSVSLVREGASCVLRVEDDGPGIPPEERERVFNRFYRILGTEEEGSGLGLAIVREIVTQTNGEVTLSDPPGGRGLLVKVRLPAFSPVNDGQY